jgi:hypothetical protein
VKQYEDHDTLYTDPATGETATYVFSVPLEVRQGTARTGSKGVRCFVCGTVVGAAEAIKRNGHFYCYRNGCYNDVMPNANGVIKKGS